MRKTDEITIRRDDSNNVPHRTIIPPLYQSTVLNLATEESREDVKEYSTLNGDQYNSQHTSAYQPNMLYTVLDNPETSDSLNR